MSTEAAPSIVTLLLEHAAQPRGAGGYTFLHDGETAAETLDYFELDRWARTIATELLGAADPGAVVLLVHKPGLEFIKAFFGCLYAGMLPVPVAPPGMRNEQWQRVIRIAADSGASLGMSDLPEATLAERLRSQMSGPLRFVAMPPQAAATPRFVPSAPASDSVALLQYSSGSTGQPKGVKVSHGNLMANQALIREKFEHSPGLIVVGWLPQYHDMGLIGNILQPLYLGGRAVLMSPASFLQRPYRWLKAIDTYGATTSGGPNFSFDLCVDRVSAEELESLDLSRWNLAFTGSEQVQARTIERFCERFHACGFRREAFYPCYGLAESTLMVSGGRQGATVRTLHVDRDSLARGTATPCESSAPRAVALVDCGEPGPGHEIRIVDPQARTPCAERAVGEIWVRGPSVALGYRDATLSGESFGATLAGEADRYLRTGDLGFMERGRLFVTGRLKDLIIIRGRNLYPQDVEQAVQSAIRVFRPGGGAAFSVPGPAGEQLVLVQEIERAALRKADFDALEMQAREIVAAAFGVALQTCVLAKPGTVPTTSSGKVRRSACRQAFLDGTLIGVHRSAPDDTRTAAVACVIEPASGSVASVLREWMARQLGVPIERIDPQRSMVAQGLDSLGATELQAAVLTRWGAMLDVAELLSGQLTLNECADRICASRNTLADSAKAEPASSPDAIDSMLSFNEESFWRLQQLHWRTGAYAIAVPAIVHGRIDIAALEHAVQSVCESHPILRTIYPERDGQPIPQIQSITEPALTVIDATSWDAGRLSDWVNDIARSPIDLARGPLFRVYLLHLGADRALLHILIHHIAADLHSMLLLTQQLAKAYGDGNSVPAQQRARVYREFARQQRAWVLSDSGQASLRFWRNRLTELPGPLALRGARNLRTASFSFVGFTSGFHIPASLARAIRAQVKSAGATLFSYLLAAYQVLLFRRTGQQRFVVGAPVSQRDPQDFGSTVGCFVDVKWFQADIRSERPFREHLERVHTDVLEVLRHRRAPLHLALEAAGGGWRSATVPFPNVRFNFQQPHALRGIEPLLLGQAGEKVAIGELLLEAFPSESQTAQADLSLTIVEREDDCLGSFTVCQDVFEKRDAASWSRQFVTLLEEIVRSDNAAVARLPLIPAGQEPDSVVRGPHREWGSMATIHELFDRQARKTPDAIAVRWGERYMDYRTLAVRANTLGHRLLQEGIKRGDRVGLYMNRSADGVVGLLALLKTGGCCVMLDPSIPPGRRRYMADDARLSALLTDRDDLEWLPHAGVRTLDIREVDLDAGPASAPKAEVTEQDAAYLIYTSGSTGTPKGVIGVHRGIVNRTQWMLEHFGIGPGDCVLHTTPLNFVRAEREIFFPLCAGATLQMLEAEGMNDPAAIVAALRRFESSFTASSPSLLRMMLAAERDGLSNLPRMRHWFIGADVLPPDLIFQLRRCKPDIQWTYFYGSTEVSSDVSCYTITSDTALEPGTIPVGTPLPNVKLYLLDEHLQPVPPGGTGILHVGGHHVSGGYWDDAALTAISFMPDPFSSDPGSRMFRTGDLAFRREDGNLVILGRNDDQVSVLGNRVALGEVARAVRGVPGIADAAVVLRVAEPDRPLLVAYVVEREPEARRRVWDSLADVLPSYMLPSFVVPVNRIPLTALGKVDRSSLPPHDPAAHGPGCCIAPHTPLQKQLVALWAEVLSVSPEQVGVRQHFFEAGGNSLLMAQFYARLRELLPGHPVRLADIYKHPNILELSRFLSDDASTDPPAGAGEHKDGAGSGSRAQARRRALRAVRPRLQ